MWSLARSISVQPIKKNSKTCSIEIYQASDIVSHFKVRSGVKNGLSKQRIDALINPCNPSLSGTKLPYFPVGGPLPNVPSKEISASTSWGGMEAGPGMMYPAQVVDGRVTIEGGGQLAQQLREIGSCPVGGAVITDATERLGEMYKYVIHTPTPFYNSSEESHKTLLKCYETSLHIACNHKNIMTVACPLLGAGCAGFSVQSAAYVLQEACTHHLCTATSLESLKIVVQSPWDIDTVLDAFEEL